MVEQKQLVEALPTHQVGESLEDLRAKIAELERQQAFHRALNHFNEVMQWQENQTLGLWCSHLLLKLIPFAEACRAVMYRWHPTTQQLVLAATYAVADLDALPTKFDMGQGLIGAAAKSQKARLMVQENLSLPLGSLLATQPAGVFLLPLVYQKQTCGVLEMVFLHQPPSETLDFLQKLAESIAGHLYNLIKEEILNQTIGQVKESEARLQRLAEVSTEGILMVVGQRVIEVNPAFLSLMGYHADEVIDQSIYKFFPSSGQELLSAAKQNATLETHCKHREGGIVHVETKCRELIANGNKVRVLNVTDITARRQAERELEQSAQRLAEAEKIVELSHIIEQKNESITSSLRYAKRIQESLMPRPQLLQQFFSEYFVIYRPRDIVSGDFYWMQQVGPKLMLAVGDCTGHGVPAAFMSMLGIATLNNIALQKGMTKPNEILDELRKEIYYLLKRNETERKEGMDVALCVIDLEAAIIEFAGARSNLIYIQDNQLHSIKGSKTYIGGELSEASFEIHHIDIRPETRLYLFSDGYCDQFGGPQSRKIGSRNFQQWLLDIHNQPMSAQGGWLDTTLSRWMEEGGETQIDDVAIIGIKL